MIYLYKGSRLPGFICICPPKRTNRKSLNSLLTFSISECSLSFSAGVWLQCRPFYVFQSNWISSKTSRDGLKIPPQLSSSWQICWFASEPGPAGCVVESNWELQGSFTVIQDNWEKKVRILVCDFILWQNNNLIKGSLWNFALDLEQLIYLCCLTLVFVYRNIIIHLIYAFSCK